MSPSKGAMSSGPSERRGAAPRRARPCALGGAVLVLALAAPGLLGAEPAPAPGVPSVESLLESFAALPGLEARFREERRIALLEAPLVSAGTVHFAPPGRFARHTTSPARASVVVADGTLSFGDESGSDRIDLDSSPTVRLFVDSFVSILAGDREALERSFTLAVTPAGEGRWELRLTPRRAEIRRVLRGVTVRGRGVVIEQIRVVEVSGDETVTTFTDVRTSRRYEAAEARRVFRVPPPR